MRQNANAPVFEGTVADLAGKIAIGGIPLNVQDVQFLTRIGEGTIAEHVGYAQGSGGRGGKKAKIWRLKPSAKLVIGEPDPEKVKALESMITTQKPVTAPVTANVVDTSSPEFKRAVAMAVAQLKGDGQPAAKRPGRPRKNPVEAAPVEVEKKPQQRVRRPSRSAINAAAS